MSDAFQRLQEQLQTAMRHEPRRSRWRHRGAVLALTAGLTATGVAVAATQFGDGGQSPETLGRKAALQAIRETTDPACRPATRRGTLVDDALLPSLQTGLALLRRPADPPEKAGPLLDRRSAVIRSSVHVVDAGGGVRLVVFVEAGGSVRATDPLACRRARGERADRLIEKRTQAARDWARRRLDELLDTVPGVQTLNIFFTHRSSQGRRAAGVDIPIRPGERLFRGLAGSSGGLYTGIADSRTVSLRLTTRTQGRRTVRVIDGLYAFRLPRRTGPVTAREHDANGRPIRSFTLRR